MIFSEKAKAFLKSLTGGEPQGEPEKKEGGDPDPNADQSKAEGGDTGDGDVEKGRLVDATEVMGSLVSDLDEINKSLKTLIENQNDVGESIVVVAEMVNRIANSPLPTKSALAKGGLDNAAHAGGGAFPAAVQQNNAPPTQEEFERAQAVLIKSYNDGEISLMKSEMISSDLQKSMRIPGYRMNPDYYNFLVSKMRTA